MGAVLVYLHIPKSAGTTHRSYLHRVYGKELVHWYGLNSDAQVFEGDQVDYACVIGGHRPIGFYPEDMDALYTAVVRNPLDRVVSFFNYCVTVGEAADESRKSKKQQEVDRWLSQGVDPSSLVRSIENCPAFREQVSNYQCRYLSRHAATLDGFLSTLETENMVIGEFGSLSKFNHYCQYELDFKLRNDRRVNAGREGYESSILSEPGVVDLIRSLNEEDYKLYEHVRDQHEGLLTKAENLQAVIARRKASAGATTLDGNIESVEWGRVHLFSKGVVNLGGGDVNAVPLALFNGSSKNVLFASTSERACRLGWRLCYEDNDEREGAYGFVELNDMVTAGEIAMIRPSFTVDPQLLQGPRPKLIQFSIVQDGEWICDRLPLTSTWSSLVWNEANES